MSNCGARFNTGAVGFCFSRYIASELDSWVPGDRGLGRISAHIPRLGAYFSKQMSRLSLQELLELYRTIQDLMLRGYLTRALLLEAPPKQAKLTTGPELYQTWLPRFYSSDPSEMGPNLRAVLASERHGFRVRKTHDVFHGTSHAGRRSLPGGQDWADLHVVPARWVCGQGRRSRRRSVITGVVIS